MTVTAIAEKAFAACSRLTAIEVDAGNRFYSSQDGVLFDKNQSALLVFPSGKAGAYIVPANVTKIAPASFRECHSLTAITVNPQNLAYSSIDGVLFNKSQTKLLQYPAGKGGSYTIPDSVVSLGQGAFFSCTLLTSVTIPETLVAISAEAFEGCTGLASVSIGNRVVSLGDEAFAGCSSLTNITIPHSVNTIGNEAFKSCTNLSQVKLGKNVWSIGERAFAYCYNLKELYFQGNAPSTRPLSFYGAVRATVYYREETAGWGWTFGSCPTRPLESNALAGVWPRNKTF